MPAPVVIATWPFGRTAAETALGLLAKNSPALDAALAGAQAVEDDGSVRSVGFGAVGNRIGTVSRDACVMDGATLNCGAVAGLENIRHAAAVAKRVMDKTPHILLVGDGALWFALQQGFPLQTHHTPESVAEWYAKHPENKKKPAADKPLLPEDFNVPIDENNHDTVTVLARDSAGKLGGVCTTSGLAYKLPGRVGDSPIIGAGLYVDDTAGAAGATGVGEEIIRCGGSFFVVEQMRAGKTPQQACEAGVKRVNAIAMRRGVHPPAVAFLAMSPAGETGAASTARTNFEYAVGTAGAVTLKKAPELGPEQ